MSAGGGSAFPSPSAGATVGSFGPMPAGVVSINDDRHKQDSPQAIGWLILCWPGIGQPTQCQHRGKSVSVSKSVCAGVKRPGPKGEVVSRWLGAAVSMIGADPPIPTKPESPPTLRIDTDTQHSVNCVPQTHGLSPRRATRGGRRCGGHNAADWERWGGGPRRRRERRTKGGGFDPRGASPSR